MAAGDEEAPLHVVFFPLPGPGDMLPMVDAALLLASRGVRSTLVTTPANADLLRPAAAAAAALGRPFAVRTVPFPSPAATGLPPGLENLASLPSSLFHAFVSALPLLAPDLSALLRSLRPPADALVSDSILFWTADLAASLALPRLLFHAHGAFPELVLSHLLAHHYPFPSSDHSSSFLLRGLPDPVRLHRRALPEMFGDARLLRLLAEANAASFGRVVNTFRALEPAYVDRLKRERPNTCLCEFGAAQLREIAAGLEASGRPFLWAVRRTAPAARRRWRGGGSAGGREGMVVVGWAPQAEVLRHEAVGWFVTHCGWNSIQEALCAGKPMMTWPLFHEQFINQELVTEVLGVGVRMWEGVRRNRLGEGEEGPVLATRDEIAAVVARAAGGGWEAAERARERAAEYKEKARRAAEEGGSTFEDVTELIEQLKARRRQQQQQHGGGVGEGEGEKAEGTSETCK
ncbi:Scopoletin glucosyltransferase [Ananas comosus]|uniref:Scopoletin glucosyltransferase n=1 Tax=Ananas comosus TaxID=4615 RepID=A0A199UKW2_ANACO|nr:Scopoletin glucosyltransferase [Ananas comosus]